MRFLIGLVTWTVWSLSMAEPIPPSPNAPTPGGSPQRYNTKRNRNDLKINEAYLEIKAINDKEPFQAYDVQSYVDECTFKHQREEELRQHPTSSSRGDIADDPIVTIIHKGLLKAIQDGGSVSKFFNTFTLMEDRRRYDKENKILLPAHDENLNQQKLIDAVLNRDINYGRTLINHTLRQLDGSELKGFNDAIKHIEGRIAVKNRPSKVEKPSPIGEANPNTTSTDDNVNDTGPQISVKRNTVNEGTDQVDPITAKPANGNALTEDRPPITETTPNTTSTDDNANDTGQQSSAKPKTSNAVNESTEEDDSITSEPVNGNALTEDRPPITETTPNTTSTDDNANDTGQQSPIKSNTSNAVNEGTEEDDSITKEPAIGNGPEEDPNHAKVNPAIKEAEFATRPTPFPKIYETQPMDHLDAIVHAIDTWTEPSKNADDELQMKWNKVAYDQILNSKQRIDIYILLLTYSSKTKNEYDLKFILSILTEDKKNEFKLFNDLFKYEKVNEDHKKEIIKRIIRLSCFLYLGSDDQALLDRLTLKKDDWIKLQTKQIPDSTYGSIKEMPVKNYSDYQLQSLIVDHLSLIDDKKKQSKDKLKEKPRLSCRHEDCF